MHRNWLVILLLAEEQKRGLIAETERLKKGLSDQNAAFSELVQNQQAETNKFRQLVADYQTTIQNKEELNRDITEAMRGVLL